MSFLEGKASIGLVDTGWGIALIHNYCWSHHGELQPTSRVAIYQFAVLILPKTATALFVQLSVFHNKSKEITCSIVNWEYVQ